MADPFIRERYEEILAEREAENTPEPMLTREVRSYLSFVEQVDALPEGDQKAKLEKLVDAVRKSVLSYTRAIDRLAKHKLGHDTSKIENADRMRTLAHEALMSNLNILSRQFADGDLDNSWRNDIGLDRRAVTRWAIGITETIRNEILEEENNEQKS
jgi:hypothetical protein